MSLLEVQGVKKVYTTRLGGSQVHALNGVSFTVEEGEYVVIMGESGSGKTTLLNILAALDSPTGGTVRLGGRELSRIKDDELAAFRRQNLGFVFQDFSLLDTFSVRDNILFPLVLNGAGIHEMDEKLAEVASSLGIEDILDKFPYEISGGQKQRTAVARAVIIKPGILLADEPTGALDSGSADELLRVFAQINSAGQTVLMVTHSVTAASHANRIMFIRDGIVFHELYRGDSSDEQLYLKISDTLSLLRRGGGRI